MVGKTRTQSATVARNTKPKAPRSATRPVLLSSGNPQIPKGEGNAPVKAYLAAVPGWKRKVGRRLDAVIDGTVPGARKAVKWNSPMYGVEDQGGAGCSARYPPANPGSRTPATSISMKLTGSTKRRWPPG